MGCIRKALEKGFSEMYGLEGGGRNRFFFLEKWALRLMRCQVSDRLHCTVQPA